MKKRFLALLLALSFVVTTAATVKANETKNENAKLKLGTTYNLDEVNKARAESEEDKEVTAIITLKENKKTDFSTLKTEEGKKQRLSETKSLRDSFKTELDSLGINYELVFEYDFLFAGFAIKTTNKNLKKIESLSSVDSVELSLEYAKPQVSKKRGDVRNGLPMNAGVGFRSVDSNELINLSPELQKTQNGQGRVVAVLDSGIDVNHPILRVSDVSKGMYKNSEEMKAKMAEVGINYGSWRNDKVVYAHNYYSNGTNVKENEEASHGMHVSGTAVGNPKTEENFVKPDGSKANELITGVAPEAQLIFMNVFNGQGSTYTHAYAKAVEDAVKLGADSVNLSLGSPNGTEVNVGKSMEKAIEFARSMGSIVAIAAGNDGHYGFGKLLPTATNPDYGTVGSPGVAKNALTVAAMNTTVERSSIVKVEGIGALKVGVVTLGAPDTKDFLQGSSEKTYEYVVVPGVGAVPGDLQNESDRDDFAGLDLNGKIALIQRGSFTFAKKIKNAHKRGAVGVIIYNSEQGGDEIMGMNFGEETNDVHIPSVFMGVTDGKKMADNKGAKNVTFTSALLVSPYAHGGTVTDFSSYGYSTDGEFKPDITAPGGLIYSSINNDKYMSMNGTSMATPHVAGAVPIVRKALMDKNVGVSGTKEYDLIKALMMSTADPIFDEGTTNYVSPRKQGSGALNVGKAISTDVYLLNSKDDMPKVALNNLNSSDFSFKVKVVNFGKVDRTLKYSTVLGTDEVANGRFTLKTRTLEKYDGEVITVPAGKTKEVTISISAEKFHSELIKLMPNGYFLEGFVIFNDSSDNGHVVSIPFSGFRGEFQNIPVWEKPIYDFDLTKADTTDPTMYAGNLVNGMNANMTSLITLEKNPYSFDKAWGNGAFNLYGEYNTIPAGFDIATKTFSRDKIAFSPNGDNNKDSIGFRGVFYRNTAYLNAKVYKYEGETVSETPVFTSGSSYFSKNSNTNKEGAPLSNVVLPTEFFGNDNLGNMLPEGKYKYVVNATSTALGASEQKLEFDVLLDRTAPVIKKPVVENGKYTPEITDNLSKVEATVLNVVLGDQNGWFFPDKDGNFQFPANADLSKSVVYTFDYAGNIAKLHLDGTAVEEVQEQPVAFNTGLTPIFRVTDFKDKDGNSIPGSEKINMFAREGLADKVKIVNLENSQEVKAEFIDGNFILPAGRYSIALLDTPVFFNPVDKAPKEFEVVDGKFTEVVFETTVKPHNFEPNKGQASVNLVIDGNFNDNFINFISYVLKDSNGKVIEKDSLKNLQRVIVLPITNENGNFENIDFQRVPYFNLPEGDYTLELTSKDDFLDIKNKVVSFKVVSGKMTPVIIEAKEISIEILDFEILGLDKLPKNIKVSVVNKKTGEKINIRKSKFNERKFAGFVANGTYEVKIDVPFGYEIDKNNFEIVVNGNKVKKVLNISKIAFELIVPNINTDVTVEKPTVEETKPQTTKIVVSNDNTKWEKQSDGTWNFKNNGVVEKDAWVKDGNHWFRVEKDGKLSENKIIEVDGSKFYAKKGGYIAEKQWVSVDGKWHYANNGGYLASNQWVKYKNNWYWLNENTVMASNQWISYKGKWYYAEKSGKITTNGWKKINGKWYHFGKDGELSVSTKIGKYYVNENGEWVK